VSNATNISSRPGSRFNPLSGWFSENPDKAWGEKFFLTFVPFFLIYNTIMISMNWLNVGNFWDITQNLGMWIPYCVLLPAFLRRNSGVAWYRSYWFKFNVFIAVYIFFMTYFGTEWFFQLLGFHYRQPHVTINYYSYVCGVGPLLAAAQNKLVPIGMYFNAIAFFIVYHTLAVLVMRRVKNLFVGTGRVVAFIAWVIIVLAAARFFGWGEPFFYNTHPNAASITWYDNIGAMLKVGAWVYALYFIVSFPAVFRLDERLDQPRWTVGRAVWEACAVSMVVLYLLDSWAWIFGPVT
jgi:cycloeucalenol cycloisomerase